MMAAECAMVAYFFSHAVKTDPMSSPMSDELNVNRMTFLVSARSCASWSAWRASKAEMRTENLITASRVSLVSFAICLRIVSVFTWPSQ